MVLESLWWAPTAETVAWGSGSAPAPHHDSDPGQPTIDLIGVQDSPTSLLRQTPAGKQPAMSRPLRARAREVTASPRSLASTFASPAPVQASNEPPAVPASTAPSVVRTRQSTLSLDTRVTSPSSYKLSPSDPPRNILISQPPRLVGQPRACSRRHECWDGATWRGAPSPLGRWSPPAERQRVPLRWSARGPPGCRRRRDRSA